MPDTTTRPITLCPVAAIPEGGSKGFPCPGEDDATLLAVKRDGAVYVYRNSCPHLGVELDWLEDQFLDLDGTFIQCATHGALFEIDTGYCVAGPCAGQSLTPVPSEVRGDEVLIRL